MRLLITGGTGFIGRSLCRRLLQSGHELVVLSRRPDRVPQRCGERVGALAKLADLSPSERFDGVINFAGEPIFGPRWTERRKQVLWDSRVTLTEQLVDYIERAEVKPAVLVSGSAIGFYGNQGDTLLTEASAAVEDFGHRLCAAWEEAARRALQSGVRVCLLRTGLVLGRDGGFLQRLLLPFRFGLGGRIGDGRQWMSWIHLDDHVAMTTLLLGRPDLQGVFNATAPQPVTNRDFTRCLAGMLRRPAFFHLPAWVARLAFGEMAELILGGQRVLPERFQAADFHFRFETLEAALQDLLGRN